MDGPEKLFVYFKTTSGKFMRLDVLPSASVANVKALLATRHPEAVGDDPARFHLVFRGHQLAEHEAITAAGVRSQQLITVQHGAGPGVAAAPVASAAQPVPAQPSSVAAARRAPAGAPERTPAGATEQDVRALVAEAVAAEVARLGLSGSSARGQDGGSAADSEIKQRLAALERSRDAQEKELQASVQARQVTHPPPALHQRCRNHMDPSYPPPGEASLRDRERSLTPPPSNNPLRSCAARSCRGRW
ncbi:hypothetical protein T484DRAFT_3643972 [Baffinella frigidus]|nr:hypothetical protein T484DRAFT_3643972 [Cryptophyta sp. CCMP2293]